MTQYFGGSSGGALGRARTRIAQRAQEAAAQDRAFRKAKAAAKKKNDDGGFSIGDLVPNLGLEDVVKTIPGIFTGAYDLATGRGGYGHAWGNFGKGLVSSLGSTARTLGDVATAGSIELPLFDGKSIGDIGSDNLGNFLASNDAEEKAGIYKPSGIEKYWSKGIAPSLLEDVGNVALGAGAVGKVAKLGEIGRAAEAVRAGEAATKAGFTEGEVAKAAEVAAKEGRQARNFGEAGIKSKVLRAAGKATANAPAAADALDAGRVASRVGVIDKAEALAHPYQSVFNRVLRPLTRAAQEEQIARIAGAVDTAATDGKALDTPVVPERVPATVGAPAEAVAPVETHRYGYSQMPDGSGAKLVDIPDKLTDEEAASQYRGEVIHLPGPVAKGTRIYRHVKGELNPKLQAILDQAVAPPSEMERAAAEAAAAQPVVNPRAANEALLANNTEPTVPLFRGEPSDVSGAATGLNFHPNELYARNFAGEGGTVRRVDVPQSVADEALANAQHITQSGADYLTPGTHALGPEWADASYLHEGPPVAPPELNAVPDAVRAAVTARDAERLPGEVIPPRVGPHELAQRVPHEIPEWAHRLVQEAAPESAVGRSGRLAEAVGRGLLSGDRVVERLAKTEGWIEGRELNLVKRERELMQVAAQRAMFHHPAVQGLVQAGRDLLVGKHLADGTEVTPDMVNEMLGNAVIAQLTGTDKLAAALPEGAPREELSRIVGEAGSTIPPELRTPELDAAISAAAEQWRSVFEQRMAILEGGRLGSKGLEQVGAETPRMNKSQVATWKEVQRDYAAAARLDPRIAREADRALKKIDTAQGKIHALDEMMLTLEDRKAKAAEIMQALFGETPPDHLTIRQVAAQMRTLVREVKPSPAATAKAARDIRAIEGQVSKLRDRIATDSAALTQELGTKAEVGEGRTARQMVAQIGPVAGETAAQARRRTYRAARLAERIDSAGEEIVQLETRKDRIRVASVTSKMVAESPGEARRRGYRAGMAAEKFDAAQAQIRAGTRRRAQLQAGLDDIHRTLTEHSLPSELQKSLITGHAQRRIDKLARQLDNPSVAAVPDQWKPLYGAMKELHKSAQDNPALAAALADVPETLSGMFRFAAEQGIDPTFVSSLTNAQVRNLVYEQVRLGKRGIDKVEEAGTRKLRKGAQAESRGIDALAASMLAASHEANTNALVSHIEDTWMREVPVNAAGKREVPNGWHAWDPERNFILRGERTDTGFQLAGKGSEPTQMIPDGVKRTIDTFSNQDKYSHAAFRAIRAVANPWRAFVLTWSPRWYVNNFVGNVVLASKEGVGMADWAAAWKSYRQRGDEAGLRQGALDRSHPRLAQPFADIPEVTQPGIVGEIGGDPHLVPYPDEWGSGSVREGIRQAVGGVKMAKRNGGVREAYNQVAGKVARANEVVDEIARAAVWHKTKRVGGTAEEALARSFEAMVDYGNLSPFEREVVRSVIPFYSWQKAMLKQVAKFPIDHPAAAGVLMQIGDLNRQLNIEEYGTDLPAAYKGLIDLPFIGTFNTRGFNPLADSASLLTPQGIAASVNPFVDAGVRNALGAPEGGFVKHQRINEFGTTVPDTSPAEDLGQIATGLPQYQVGAGLFGGGAYPGAPTGAQAAERFTGIPTYTQAQVRKIIARSLKSQKRIA